MFNVADREKLRARLVEVARHHPDIETAALLGSAARGEEDRWSDIDLALGLAPGVDPVQAAKTWTTVVEQTEPLVDHLDINASGGLYRVLLLASTLQVDLSFWPHRHFPTGSSPVKVLFGHPDLPQISVEPQNDLSVHVRMSWLYALHLRSAVGRGRSWQALWMLDGIRNQVIALLCVRYELPAAEGRGVDRLPLAVLSELADTLPKDIDTASIIHSARRLVLLLVQEAERQSLLVPVGLAQVLEELTSDSTPGLTAQT